MLTIAALTVPYLRGTRGLRLTTLSRFVVIWLSCLAVQPGLMLGTDCLAGADDKVRSRVEAAEIDQRGVRVHVVDSGWQSRTTRIEVILPAGFEASRRYPVVYVLPVEAQGDARFGDATRELVERRFSERYPVIFVVPTFADLPWYADHPTRVDLQQEKYFLQVILPFIERTYPVMAERRGRLLLGYSKSGWGAWSLILRHPDLFERAAAWDAPLMMNKPGNYGSGPIFGGEENFARYHIEQLVTRRADQFRDASPPRLILAGYDNFRGEHVSMHGLLDNLRVPHVYRDGPRRKHDWHSGWVAESLELLLDGITLAHATEKNAANNDAPTITRLAFGSCVKQDKPQPIWDAVVAAQPEMFVFLGDNIYGDTEDMEVLKAKYAQLGQQPGYQKLKATCPIYATWDDHDYGVNDGGVEYPRKRESQQVFLDFFEVPAGDTRRTREGVYWSHVFGPAGRRIQLILLDARYFRSPLKTGFQPQEPGDGYRGKYLPNEDDGATMLGEAQWKWLAEQLAVPAELRLIGSGVQVITEEHGSEMWANFPRERRRLFETIKNTGAHGVIFLSGDRHLAEISRLPANDPLGVGYPLFDITSSSLNTPSGNFTKAGARFANEINRHRVGLTYFDTNFGMVHVDWEKPDPEVRIQVRDEQGGVVLQQRVTLSQLRPRP